MNMHFMAPIGGTGYGYVALHLLKELSYNHGAALSLIGQPNVETQEQANAIQKSIELVHEIEPDAPALKIWHQFDLLVRPGKGKYFAFPFFEVDTFNDTEKYHLSTVDEIIVACGWAKNVLENNNIDKPIHVVPMGVDSEIFNPLSNQPHDNYTFATVGKWEKRKAHDIIIHCFNKAFTENDNVELWLVTENPFLKPEEKEKWTNLVESSPLRDKIKLFPRLPNQQSVAQVMSYTDCGIYISRGEGWNMELLETMALNKPVIASNYSAHTEYCNDQNSFLVDMDETEEALDGKWFHGNSNWGKIGSDQIEQTISHMRKCYENRITDNPEGLKTAQNLTWKNSCHQLIGCMS